MKGSVHRRGKAWRAVVDAPRGPDGMRRQRSKTFRTRAEAEEWLAVAVVSGGGAPGRSLTLTQFLDLWLESALPSLKPNTRATYGAVARRIGRELGGVRLAALTPLMVQAAINRWAERLSRDTVKSTRAVLKVALGQAEQWGYVARNAAGAGIRLPRGGRREQLRCWSEQQVATFLRRNAESHRYGVIFWLALATGMRIGEVLGLHWQDVDWQAGVLGVRHSLAWPSGGRPEIVEPKTAGSARSVPVDAGTVAALRRQQARQGRERLLAAGAFAHPELVFTTRGGNFVCARNLNEPLHRLARRAGLPPIRVHDLRHTHATILLRQGRNIKEVADRLGHSSPDMLLRRYAHVLPDQRVEVAETIGRVLQEGRAGSHP